MTKIYKLRQVQFGFTLVETMVALSLGAVVLAALVNIISQNRANINLSESYSQVQESGRLSMEILSREFRLLGFHGCLNTNDASKLNNRLDTNDTSGATGNYDASVHNYANSISVIDNLTATVLYGGIQPQLGTDVITSRSAVSSDISLTSAPVQSGSTETLKVSGPPSQLNNIGKGNIVMVSDCETADLFSVDDSVNKNEIIFNTASNDKAPKNASSGFSSNYTAGDKIWVMNTASYFIAPSRLVGNVVNGVSTNVTSLYKTSQLLGDNAVELVPYISDFQLEYGIDTNDDRSPDAYKTAATLQPTDDLNTDLISVKVSLSVQSSAKVDGSDFSRSYSRVIQLRNSKVGI